MPRNFCLRGYKRGKRKIINIEGEQQGKRRRKMVEGQIRERDQNKQQQKNKMKN